MRRIFLTALLSSVLWLAACQGGDANRAANAPPAKGGDTLALKLTSTAFEDGGMIPSKYTCDGANVSPPLAWSGVPGGAKSLALVVDDPDAPRGTWVHWVVYQIPATEKGFAEGAPDANSSGVRQGTNDFGKQGYGGPCPPTGTHRYFFKLYALDGEPNLPQGVSKGQLLRAVEGHVLAEGQLVGRYQRGK
jgi:Raf kinase inhibitor-like YbhB/YbcL family protein